MAPDITPFVILSAPRSGSNMLCTILDGHPDILCHHELFNPRGIFVALRVRDRDLGFGRMDDRDRDPTAFLDRVWRTPLGHAIVGMKMTAYQNRLALGALIGDRAIRKIVLRRGNLIKTYVSTRIAEALDQWEVYDQRDLAPERPRVHVKVAELHAYAAEIGSYYDDIRVRIRASGQEFFEAWYERLSSVEEQARMFDFLGAAPIALPIQARSVKQNSRQLRDLVSNYDELVDGLRGDPLQADLFLEGD